MTSGANTIPYFTKTGIFVATKLPSGLAANTDSLCLTESLNGSCITDILIRNTDASNGRTFDLIFCTTGSNGTVEKRVCQFTVPLNSGNNGTVALASVATLVPQLFDLDLAGNRILNLEPGWSIYLRNATALTADIYVNIKQRSF